MASKTYEIAFHIASKLSGSFGKSFSTAKETVTKLNSELNKFNSKIAEVDKVYRMRKEVGQAARAYHEARQKATELGQAISKTDKPTKKMTAEFEKARAAVTKAKNTLNKKRQALSSLQKTAGTTGMSLKQLIQHKKELTAQADKARASIDRLTATQKKIEKISETQAKWTARMAESAVALGKIGMAAKGFYSAIIEPSMALQDGMADVRKVTDATEAEMAELTRQVEDISLRTPVAAEGLAQIMAAAAQANVAKKDLGEFTERAAQMAVAFDITAEESGTMMAKWQSGMKLSMKDVYALGDAVNTLSNKNAALAAEVGEVLKRFGSLGDISGLNAKEVAAFGATIIASGVAPDIAATSMKAVMREMAAGARMTDAQAAAFKYAGFGDPKQLQKMLQKDGPGTIVKVLEGIQKNIPKEKWNMYLSEMFGDRGMQAIGPMMKNLDLLKRNFALVAKEANYAGSMYKEYQNRCTTASNATQLLKNALDYTARSIGKPLLEPLRKTALAIGEVVSKIGAWLNENPALVSSVMSIVVPAMLFATAFHGIRLALGFMISPLLSLIKLFPALKLNLIGINAAIRTGTATTLGQKVALLAHNAALKLWSWTVTAAKAVWIAFKSVLSGAVWVVQKTAMIAAKAALLAWNATVTAAKAVWIALKAVFSAGVWIAHTVAMVAAKAALLAWNAICLIWKGICIAVTAVQWLWNAALAANPIGAVIIAVTALVAAGVALWKNWDTIIAKVKALWQAIKKFFGKIGDAISRVFGGGKLSVDTAVKATQYGGPRKMATGGIATGPTFAMIGEGKEPEAVVPLSKLDSMLSNGTRKGKAEMIINFQPVINITDNSGKDKNKIQHGLSVSQDVLKKELEKLLRNERRLSFA